MISPTTILEETRDMIIEQIKMLSKSDVWDKKTMLLIYGGLDVLNFLAQKKRFVVFLKSENLFTENQKIWLEVYHYEYPFSHPLTSYHIVGDENE